MKKRNDYEKAVDILIELHKLYPTYELGQHISTAFSEYPDMWGITDREFLFALNKYQAELQLDNSNIVDELYVSKVVSDGINLQHLFDDEEEEDEE